MSTVPAETMPLTGNGATAEPFLDQKIDPSIGQAISHGNEAEVSPTHATTYPNGTATGAPANDVVPLEASHGLGGGSSSIPESSAAAPAEVPTTTTTTIM